jgi:hypothetical protein
VPRRITIIHNPTATPTRYDIQMPTAMAATTAQSATKASKKKAPKAVERTDSPAPSTASGSADKAEGQDGFESPYIKELQKYVAAIVFPNESFV